MPTQTADWKDSAQDHSETKLQTTSGDGSYKQYALHIKASRIDGAQDDANDNEETKSKISPKAEDNKSVAESKAITNDRPKLSCDVKEGNDDQVADELRKDWYAEDLEVSAEDMDNFDEAGTAGLTGSWARGRGLSLPNHTGENTKKESTTG